MDDLFSDEMSHCCFTKSKKLTKPPLPEKKKTQQLSMIAGLSFLTHRSSFSINILSHSNYNCLAALGKDESDVVEEIPVPAKKKCSDVYVLKKKEIIIKTSTCDQEYSINKTKEERKPYSTSEISRKTSPGISPQVHEITHKVCCSNYWLECTYSGGKENCYL